ncbi:MULTISPECIES: tol-pal system protein YbgF [unclassified Colwellia]|jgi:tol-pal system protein YbgF|uniref:tol-pal system protein YbgF n=1 Tax=unclassified Colwellia TaxID=196834 RepID=UPI000D3A0059|nr:MULTISPECIES: tol-pal system protein YbgF [unclassified Colwellia]AWB58456.1 tol-pal system protein YbgF [Colwellia sp. Arc7-D]MBA6416169.1 tol-pal system protein YbgF [Colwellia sp. 6M3]
MKPNSILFGMSFAVAANLAVAAEPAPVIEINAGTSTSGAKSSLSDQLVSLERKLDARNRAQVNVQRQLDELQNEVNELRGITELHTYQLSQVLDRQRELYQELDRRVSEALKPANQIPATISAASTGSGQANYSNNLTENEAYDRAVNMVLKDKRYEQAIPEFEAFNQRYPNSSYAANAHYWLGQLLFNKGELGKARQEFDVVVNNYPDSSKRSDAMLKLAMVEQKENNQDKAIAVYKKLMAEYPNSSAAKLAQPRLKNLKP